MPTGRRFSPHLPGEPKAGLDPERYGVISFAFGLERAAQVHHDLDDIRKLWQPPYLPE